MKRTTDKLVALQFIAVALPIAVVLLAQLGIDAQRAAALAHSRPLRLMADQARANYRTFTNGAADAVDTGALGAQSVEALHTSADRLKELTDAENTADATAASEAVSRLASEIRPGTTLEKLLAMRDLIMRADTLTRNLDDEFQRRDEYVVKDAIQSSVKQRHAVIAALFATAILSLAFVLKTRQRLKERMEEEFAIERKRRAELETLSVRIGIATRAARAGIYEVRRSGSEVWWSDMMYELYSQAPGSVPPDLHSWLSMIHPEDRAAAYSAMTSALDAGQPMRSQYRIVRPDGTCCHIASLAAVVPDAIDQTQRLVGIDLDITDRVEAEERERDLQRQLRDASRQAGMAEIATNVLHNVGNVLNSVNVSASLVANGVRRSRSVGLGKVVAMLQNHSTELGAFVAHDPRGMQLTTYLCHLTEQLRFEQSEIVKELDSLRENIDHIKGIVSMQQSYAKRRGLPERTSVASLVEDALRISGGAFAQRVPGVQCEFEKVPDVVVDKHCVVQILINLLRNAIHACETLEASQRQIRVRITNIEDGVRISVTDNGVGIAPENMAKLFRHGFTTKRDGHGFGLHSGALSAKEMGGSLTAESAGPGKGSVFTLDLPLKTPETAHA